MKYPIRHKINLAIKNFKNPKSININKNTYKLFSKELSDYEVTKIVLYNNLIINIKDSLKDNEIIIK